MRLVSFRFYPVDYCHEHYSDLCVWNETFVAAAMAFFNNWGYWWVDGNIYEFCKLSLHSSTGWLQHHGFILVVFR